MSDEVEELDIGTWSRWMVAAIKKIRSQKQRPSAERIVHAIRQHHDFHEEVISEALDRCVKTGSVLKVYNKGQSTYKDPHGGPIRQLNLSKYGDLSKVIVKAARELGEREGSSLKSIERHILLTYDVDIPNDIDLSAVLRISTKRAIALGSLVKCGNNFKAVEDSILKKKEAAKRDFSTEPLAKEPPRPVCSECLSPSRNQAGEEEPLVSCSGCSSRIHASCAPGAADFAIQLTLGARWQCSKCAQCATCSRRNQVPCLLSCAGCGTCHHWECLDPVPDNRPKRPWRCRKCLPKPTNKMGLVEKGVRRKYAKVRRTGKMQRSGRGRTVVKKLSVAATAPPVPGLLKAARESSKKMKKAEDETKATTGRREESNDNLSKEKQLFFRQSVFNVDKKSSSRSGQSGGDTWGFAAAAAGNQATTPGSLTLPPDTDRPSGIGQLKGLFDGLSHLFAAPSPTRGRNASAIASPAEVPPKKDPSPVRQVTPKTVKRTARIGLTPSRLVKTAASKQLEHERRRLLEESSPAARAVDPASPDAVKASLPPGVTPRDVELFKLTRERANLLTSAPVEVETNVLPERCPAAIEFGKYDIDTWYSSPFPEEYASLPKLFLCEFCLKYTKSKAVLERHQDKCTWRNPPGTEVYRSCGLSVFEVDGNVNKIYCQNLCLLAKLFLDHKTLYYDVEPFLFYILTSNDEKGCHLVGYFSKEKHCAQKYNVSCIMTMPQYQRQGFGRFLIHFSYLLSKEEGQPGTPEKPLSDLGRVSYYAYWKSVVIEYLWKRKSSASKELTITIADVSKETGMYGHDVAYTLQMLGMVRLIKVQESVGYNPWLAPAPVPESSRLLLCVDWSAVQAQVERAARSRTRINIDPECLRWKPLVTTIPNPYREVESESPTEKNPSPTKEATPLATPSTPVTTNQRKRKYTTEAAPEYVPAKDEDARRREMLQQQAELQSRVIEKQGQILKSMEKARGGRRSRGLKAEKQVESAEEITPKNDLEEATLDAVETPTKKLRIEPKSNKRKNEVMRSSTRKRATRTPAVEEPEPVEEVEEAKEEITTPLKSMRSRRNVTEDAKTPAKTSSRPRRATQPPIVDKDDEEDEEEVEESTPIANHKVIDSSKARKCRENVTYEEKSEQSPTKGKRPGRGSRNKKSNNHKGSREDKMPELEPEIVHSGTRRNSLAAVSAAPALSPAHPQLAAPSSPTVCRSSRRPNSRSRSPSLRRSKTPLRSSLDQPQTPKHDITASSPQPTVRRGRSESLPQSPSNNKQLSDANFNEAKEELKGKDKNKPSIKENVKVEKNREEPKNLPDCDSVTITSPKRSKSRSKGKVSSAAANGDLDAPVEQPMKSVTTEETSVVNKVDDIDVLKSCDKKKDKTTEVKCKEATPPPSPKVEAPKEKNEEVPQVNKAKEINIAQPGTSETTTDKLENESKSVEESDNATMKNDQNEGMKEKTPPPVVVASEEFESSEDCKEKESPLAVMPVMSPMQFTPPPSVGPESKNSNQTMSCLVQEPCKMPDVNAFSAPPNPLSLQEQRQHYENLVAAKEKAERLKNFEKIREEIERKEKEQKFKLENPVVVPQISPVQAQNEPPKSSINVEKPQAAKAAEAIPMQPKPIPMAPSSGDMLGQQTLQMQIAEVQNTSVMPPKDYGGSQPAGMENRVPTPHVIDHRTPTPTTTVEHVVQQVPPSMAKDPRSSTPMSVDPRVPTPIPISHRVPTPLPNDHRVATPISTIPEVRAPQPMLSDQRMQTPTVNDLKIPTPLPNDHRGHTPLPVDHRVPTPLAVEQQRGNTPLPNDRDLQNHRVQPPINTEREKHSHRATPMPSDPHRNPSAMQADHRLQASMERHMMALAAARSGNLALPTPFTSEHYRDPTQAGIHQAVDDRRVRTPAMMDDPNQSQVMQNTQSNQMSRTQCMREDMHPMAPRYTSHENQIERTYTPRLQKEEGPRDPTPDRDKSETVEWGDKRTPPTPGPDIPSMGVYTPDSTTNSVHSLHGYGQCELDVSQLGLESPTSIGSTDIADRATFECPQMMAGSPQHMQQYMQHLHHGAKSKHRSRTAQAHKPQLSPHQRGPSPQQRRAASPIQQAARPQLSPADVRSLSCGQVPQSRASASPAQTMTSEQTLQLHNQMLQQHAAGYSHHHAAMPMQHMQHVQTGYNNYMGVIQHRRAQPPPCSLTKLQQLTDMCPSSTPPPPPQAFYQGMQDMGMGSSSRSARSTPAVHQMNANLVQYPGLNGYRMTQQGAVPPYISNSAGFMNQLNQGQVPVQMMNMQPGYQDPTRQQGMYPTYPYLMQPLNGAMRR